MRGYQVKVLPVFVTVVTFAILCVASVNRVHADLVEMYHTGVDDGGGLLSGGDQDPHYTVLNSGDPAIVRSNEPGSYYQDADAKWIWVNESGDAGDTIYTFRTTFDLTGFDHTTMVINGGWAVDNIGRDVFLNGVATGIQLPNNKLTNFQEWHTFTIDSGFQPGVNTLDFEVRDLGEVGGLRVELVGTAEAVPEPPLGMFCLALLAGAMGVEWCRRRCRALSQMAVATEHTEFTEPTGLRVDPSPRKTSK